MLKSNLTFKQRNFVILLILFVSGCSVYVQQQFDDIYGVASVQDRTMSSAEAEQAIEYHRDLEPLVERRCVVCHGCYDAPCQLKMDAFEGIDRGASKNRVYNGARLLKAEPSRLFEDALATEQWRDKQFYPVLNERTQNAEFNREAGVLYRLLDLKRQHPLPDDEILPDSFDFSLSRSQYCPSIEEMDHYEKQYPLWGMPYGLPALSDAEFNTFERWIEQGAKRLPPGELNEQHAAEVQRWEAFLNGDSLKEQLVSRYIYEHLFLGHLYFADLPQGDFFKLVRSATPPGEPVELIATRRPYDDPGVERVYYRLQQIKTSIVAKSHMPYRLDTQRLQRWQSLFFKEDYEVPTLPGWEPGVASNPFIAFEQLPVVSRYKFMLDEAQYTIMGFIKGPVCRGQTALNVIQDHFWVMFVDPDNIAQNAVNDFLKIEKEFLSLPSEQQSNALPLTSWRKYSRLHRKFLEDRDHYLQENFPNREGISMNLIWDGGAEKNPNAALTIFRHFDSASVHKGFIGNEPKTAWVIGYSLLERIHYLLVAGYDVYGNVGHQLNTRLYMDFLRMEGEYNFLLFLPGTVAEQTFDDWYRDAESDVSHYLVSLKALGEDNPEIVYHSDNPKRELFDKLFDRIPYEVASRDELNWKPHSRLHDTHPEGIEKLTDVKGSLLTLLPDVALIRVRRSNGSHDLYTLTTNRALTNVSQLFSEDSRLLPDDYTLTVVKGVIGDYPNAFFDLHDYELETFATALASLETEDDYRALMSAYGVRRNDPAFWAFSDWVHDYNQQAQPIAAGILDYNRLQNR